MVDKAASVVEFQRDTGKAVLMRQAHGRYIVAEFCRIRMLPWKERLFPLGIACPTLHDGRHVRHTPYSCFPPSRIGLAVSEREEVIFTGMVWVWQARSGDKPVRWFFVSIEGEAAAAIRLASLGLTAGFGSVPVRASVGATSWRTSVFPQRESGGWILPLKAEVRKRAGIVEGSQIEVSLEI